MVDKVISAILDSTTSGLAGEGKIFASDVDDESISDQTVLSEGVIGNPNKFFILLLDLR